MTVTKRLRLPVHCSVKQREVRGKSGFPPTQPAYRGGQPCSPDDRKALLALQDTRALGRHPIKLEGEGGGFLVERQVRSKVNVLLFATREGGEGEALGRGPAQHSGSGLAATQCPHSSAGSRNKALWGPLPSRRTSVGGGGRVGGGDEQ